MLKILTDNVEFLEKIADTLDSWAKESKEGGWSTHQVEANLRLAKECRRKAGLIKGIVLYFKAVCEQI